MLARAPRWISHGLGWIPAFLGFASSGCRSDDTIYIGAQAAAVESACNRNPSAPVADLMLDPFYEKALDAGGIPVLGSGKVDDRALQQACVFVTHLLPLQPEILAAMVEHKLRVAVIGPTEKLTEIPEYRDLYAVFPRDDWDALRGVGATVLRPVSSVGQENLLCTSDNDSPGEFLLPQTFSHGLRSLGIEPTNAQFATRLRGLFGQAMAAGLWTDTFAASEASQYFAEGIQDWFDANGQASPADGIHNEINTRTELRGYDSALASLVAEYLADDGWRPRCP